MHLANRASAKYKAQETNIDGEIDPYGSKKDENKNLYIQTEKNVCIKIVRSFTDPGLQNKRYQFQRLAWPSGGLFNAEVFSVSILERVFKKGSVFTSGACTFYLGKCFESWEVLFNSGKCVRSIIIVLMRSMNKKKKNTVQMLTKIRT